MRKEPYQIHKKLAQMINELFHFYRVPFSLLLVVWTYYFKKLLGKKMDGTFGEWAHILYRCTLITKGHVFKEKDGSWRLKLSKGITLFVRNFPSSDVKVLLQVWGVQEYKGAIDKLQTIYSNINPLKMIDAGANVGYTSVYFKTKFPNASIVAIEPASINFSCLQKNIEVNDLTNVQLENCALWHKKAFLQIEQSLDPGNEWAFTVKEAPVNGIESIGIREIMGKMNWREVDVVKMDIEGAEKYFFVQGDENNWLDDIKFIIIEVHPIKDLEEIVCSVLNDKGFGYFNYGELKVAYKKKL
jgi:FkbM family methyltransferase